MKIVFENAKLLTPFRFIKNGGVIINDGKIIEVFQGKYKVNNNEDKVIDLKGKYVSPGFIDIHTHGGGNYDFMDGTVEALIEGCRAHMFHGTTSIIPTTLTSTIEELFKTFDNFKIARKNFIDGPELLGLHLEGPYFSVEQRGAQDLKYIKNPDRDEYMKILDYTNDIVRWTVAPELDGALDLGVELRNRGIIACIGHSNAVYEQVLEAFECGYRHITHLYSGDVYGKKNRCLQVCRSGRKCFSIR